MKKVFEKTKNSLKHLEILNDIFLDKDNFSNVLDWQLYKENYAELSQILTNINFHEKIYGEKGRQMILADIIEYIFFSRGIFSLIDGKTQLIKGAVPKFIELILRFVNLLMLYEIMTTDNKIRKAFLLRLKEEIKEIENEKEFNKLLEWGKWVGLTAKETPENAPSSYFDSILPKTAGGLWHEMLVYAFVLRFNIGYIFPLLLHQKIISLDKKLSPPDLLILHKKTGRYYGIEIGTLKERQSGGFMAPSGIPVIPLDTLNCRISDRCPACKKWIGICPNVISNFSNPNHEIKRVEIRCLYDCDRYTLNEKIEGKCPYMKYFYKKLHYHYNCLIDKKKQDVIKDIIIKHHLTEKELMTMLSNKEIKNLPCKSNDMRSKKINYLKTHYLWYSELSRLIQMNKTIEPN